MQYRAAAGAALLSWRIQDLACSLGAAAEGGVDYWAAQPPPHPPTPPPPTPPPPHPAYLPHISHTLSSPPVEETKILLDRGIHKRHLIPSIRPPHPDGMGGAGALVVWA